jgi:solute carrier family 25 iron transporter 28/37
MTIPPISPPSPSSFVLYDIDEDFVPEPGFDAFKAMIAGSTAGVMEHVCMYPVDTIKTRLQASVLPLSSSSSLPQAGQYTSLFDCVFRMAREEGPMRFYRGISATVMAAIPSHAVHFATYEFIKDRLGGNEPGHHPIAAGIAGAMATCAHDAVVTPLDLVKQRLQLYNSHYSGVVEAVRVIARQEGLSAFYASYPTTVLMNIPFMAAHFSAYETLKKVLTAYRHGNDTSASSWREEFLAGACAGGSAGLVSNPIDVVKTQIQIQEVEAGQKRDSVITHVKRIFQREGFRGFLKGASARVVYFLPSSAICFSTYEHAKRFLKEAW